MNHLNVYQQLSKNYLLNFLVLLFVLKDLIEVFVSLLLFPEQAIKVTVVDTAIKPKVNFFLINSSFPP